MYKIIWYICVIALFSGCPQQTKIVITGDILEPEKSASFLETQIVLFKSSSNAAKVSWKSSIDGIIGTHASFSRQLSSGKHTIQLLAENILLDSVIINIKPVTYRLGESIKIQLYNDKHNLLLAPGNYKPVFYSLAKKTVNIELDMNMEKGRSIHNIPVKSEADGESFFKKKLGIQKMLREKTLTIKRPFCMDNRQVVIKRKRQIGDVRTFTVADTTNPSGAGHRVNAELYATSQKVNIWVDENSRKDTAILDIFCSKIADFAAPRVMALWGTWADINNNGAIDVLLTPRINQEGIAIGFFNTGDFYPLCEDTSSSDYNVLTNEMDIIYLADPCEQTDVFAYSVDSIAATFCHEFSHVVNFSHKVYWPKDNGITEVRREKLFLDEGLAHLTESLCGFGESGGNLAFFSCYLKEPQRYSLKGADRDGAADSAGKRGGVSAFLSWLFWKKGGISWSADTPGKFVDNGGAAFLQKLIGSDSVGWENISLALGSSADSAFRQWIHYLNTASAVSTQISLDPITGEANSIDAYFGNLHINDKIYMLAGPIPIERNSVYSLIPYSAVFIKPFSILNKQCITILPDICNGLVLSEFYMHG